MQSNDTSKDNASFFKKFSHFDGSLIEQEIGGGYYRLGIKEAEKRQAKHDIRWVEDALLELLRNSRDAKATSVAVATSLHDGKIREILVIDNGTGIPEEFHEVVFEPRVTSRVKEFVEDEYGVHGRGMALYSIRLNAVEARVCFSKPFAGTSIKAVFDLEEIPERKNQAEKPRVVRTQEGIELRGQKNILYTLVDFSLKNPHIEVFLGSPAEILSLVLFSAQYASLRNALELDSLEVSKIMEAARKLGVEISRRTAYRIIEGSVSRPINIRKAFSYSKKKAKFAGWPSIHSEDWQDLTSGLKSALHPYLNKYELEIVEIRQFKSKGKVKIQVILEPSEDF